MKVRTLHQPLELDLLEVEHYESKTQENLFFEMVFVLEGEGVQVINDHKLPYAKDKLFLIFPQDKHSFEVKTPSKFFFVRFNESYLKTQEKEWIRKIEYIFHNHNHLPGCILKTITDKPLVRALVEALIREQVNQQPQQQEVIRQIINTLIIISGRNLLLQNPVSNSKITDSNALQLMNYIHQNIYNPRMLKAKELAKHFNVSLTYVSEYFKSIIGESLQNYIIAYKLKLIETRLQYTDIHINELVYELGFSDVSHLNRIFKKYKGVSPSEYRKQAREAN
ncbi:helix-turn-helix domain-containing protein [Maribellus comscasis]|uniref:Helix-turn-helix domain-containing protein n=1 Tax=Maribellus comscasis TaxID=2681766 RepID=A0A6I6JQV6_9BACT|nr:AraC family transcriptional regulator [Maribellus comscasis]QGY42487.1 helix-turn-helix domain-containing protein [Maribellus comscasis]